MTQKTREQQARARVAKSWDEYKRAYVVGSDIEQGRAWDHMNHAIKALLSFPQPESIKPGSTFRICNKCGAEVEGAWKCKCEFREAVSEEEIEKLRARDAFRKEFLARYKESQGSITKELALKLAWDGSEGAWFRKGFDSCMSEPEIKKLRDRSAVAVNEEEVVDAIYLHFKAPDVGSNCHRTTLRGLLRAGEKPIKWPTKEEIVEKLDFLENRYIVEEEYALRDAILDYGNWLREYVEGGGE